MSKDYLSILYIFANSSSSGTKHLKHYFTAGIASTLIC